MSSSVLTFLNENSAAFLHFLTEKQQQKPSEEEEEQPEDVKKAIVDLNEEKQAFDVIEINEEETKGKATVDDKDNSWLSEKEQEAIERVSSALPRSPPSDAVIITCWRHINRLF